MKRGRVLLITPFFRPNIGGVETRLNDLCEELNSRGLGVTVLTYQPLITKAKGLWQEKKGNIVIHRFWWFGFDLFHKLKPYPILQTLYIFPVLFIATLFFLILNRAQVSVVHTAGFNAALIGRILKPVFKIRWVVTTHAIYDLKKDSLAGRLLPWILNRADKIMTLSEPSRQELIKCGVSTKKIINQITWVNQEIFKPLDKKICREQLGFAKVKFLVLFVGRLLAIKGIESLVNVAKETPDIDYIFVGDGPLASYLKKESGISNNIHFASSVENKDLPVYYNAADVFLMPSQYKEGLGRVTVEALSCGIPVIVSNLGGIAYILDNSVSVMIEPTKDNLQKSISYLYNHPEELLRMSKLCRDFALDKFSVKNFQVILEAYNLN